MKLFSLKKQQAAADTTSQPAEAATQAPEQAASELLQTPLVDTTKPTMLPAHDEFSLDDIDLSTLEQALFDGEVTDENQASHDAKTPMADQELDQTNPQKPLDDLSLMAQSLSFDDFDIDAPSQESLTVLTPSSSSSSQHPPSQHDQVLDDIQIDENEWQGSSPNNNINDINDKPVAALPLSDADDHPYQPPFIQNIDTTAPSGIAASSDIDMHAEPAALLAANPQVSAAAQTQKNTASKEPTLTLDGKMTNSLLATTIAKPRKTPKKSIVYGALGLSLLAVGAWVFFSQSTNAPTTVPAPVKTAPKAAVQPVASTPAMSASGVIANTVIASEQASAAASTVVVSTLSPQDILKPALPQDPAIAQEELDRLAQQSEQLKEQEVMIQEQIRMMNELSDKKAERIKLLEQQVAKLEQQNNTAAKP